MAEFLTFGTYDIWKFREKYGSMSPEERAWLQSPEGLDLVEKNLDADPVQFVLRHQKAGAGIPLSAAATQIKYLQRARSKLPSWFEARCLLPARAFEQCSSEKAAQLKPFISGTRALDLTCGLGVDTHRLSGLFEEVIALEADPELAAVTAWNLRRMGCDNVDLRQLSAEDFLDSYDGPPFDLVYIDPDRRDQQGRRKYALADCRPDVLALREKLEQIGTRVMIKLSPMLDITELRRQLAPIDRITVIAVDHECKEVLVELGASDGFRLGVSCLRGEQSYRFEMEPHSINIPVSYPETGEYAYEPDISLYKAGLTGNWWTTAYPDLPGGVNHPEGYYFSPEFVEDFPGRVYEVEEVWRYQPQKIKQALLSKGLKRINLSRRYFDVPLKKVREQASINEGGDAYLLLTLTPKRERIAILARRLQ
jgi:predicted O-methyltransferase YrrM